jgi:FkbM family methyltransferase
MGIVSYSQNLEDVILWRAVGDIQNGFYIDIGAWHPTADSVSKAFYEHGWRGIHVEPTAEMADLLRRDRPDETVIQALVSAQPGVVPFYEVIGTGLSTARKDIAQEHALKHGFEVVERVVTSITLDSLLSLAPTDDIHWLKIDVEGHEREVLAGWRESPRRPWIIVVEATYPNTQRDTYADWEDLILQKKYLLVYRDGLNRFYLHEQHLELEPRFAYPPNIFDGFQLSGNTCWTDFLVNNHRKAIAELEAKLTKSENELYDAKKTVEEIRAEAAKLEAKLKEELQNVQLALDRAIETAATREHELRAELERALAEAHRQSQAQLRELVEREQQLAEQILAQQRQAQAALSEQAQAHAEREAALEEELKALRATLERVRETAATREHELRAELERALAEAHRQSQAQLRELVEREQQLAEQILAQQRQAQAALSEQAQAHAEREAALEEELKALRATLERVRETAATREHELRAELERALAEAHRQSQAQLRELVEREQQLAEQQMRLQTAWIKQERELHERLLVEQQKHHVTEMQLAEKTHALIALTDEKAHLDQQIANQIDRIQQLSDELSRIHGSIFWRLTVPLRAFAARRTSKQRRPDDQVSAFRASVSSHEAATVESQTLADSTQSPAIEEQHKSNRKPEQSYMNEKSTLTKLLQKNDADFIEACFLALLGRAPDPDGLHYYLGRLNAGHSKRSILAQIARSQKGTNRETHLLAIPDDAAFLTATYHALLGRSPDPDGFQHYLDFLRQGGDRRQIIRDIQASPEWQVRAPERARFNAEIASLVEEERKARHWFWRWFARGDRLERQLNRLELALGRLQATAASINADLQARLSQIEERLAENLSQAAPLMAEDVRPNTAQTLTMLSPQAQRVYRRLLVSTKQ